MADQHEDLVALGEGEFDRYAVIDVGTNSVKLLVAERLVDAGWRWIVDRPVITRLGEGLEQSGEIAPAAVQRTIAAISSMAAEARREGVRSLVAAGTAGLRAARNRGAVIEAITGRTGVVIEVLSADEEARIAYLGATAVPGMSAGASVVFDTGGGSTQLTFGRGSEVLERFSVEVGSVRITERFGLDAAVTPAVLGEARAAISAALSRLDGRPVPDALVGMGGSVTAIAAVGLGLAVYDPDIVQGSILTRAEVERQAEHYRRLPADERRSTVGLRPAHAEVILAGTCIVGTVMDMLGCGSLAVSDRGLRHGLLAERFGA